MPTRTTSLLEQTIRTRLLGWPEPLTWIDGVTGTPTSGTLADFLATLAGGGSAVTPRLWIDWPPNDAAYPYGVLATRLAPSAGVAGQQRVAGIAEVMLYARSAADRPALKDAGDLAVRAFTGWANTTDVDDGLLVVTGASAQSIPAPSEPADRELITIRVTASFYAHPAWLDPTTFAGL